MNTLTYIYPTTFILFLISCSSSDQQAQEKTDISKDLIPIILDTDANNELDDQHAMAYALFNDETFDVMGITVNATFNGGKIENHVAEAERIVSLCGKYGEGIPVIPGASKDYAEIVPQLDSTGYDGQAAVDFIIEQVRADTTRIVTLVPIGTLTNVALALEKAPDIIPFVKVMWLGSNWPNAGEYNLDNDTTSVNPLLDMEGLDFQICTVRYGEPSGTAAVTASVEEIRQTMASLGPEVAPVEGRDGGIFTAFGDYSIDLFEEIGNEKRALFDVCALALLKNDSWAEPVEVPAPELVGNGWRKRPSNTRKVVFWENFDKEAILKDFYETIRNAK